jgi:hypothetical protein
MKIMKTIKWPCQHDFPASEFATGTLLLLTDSEFEDRQMLLQVVESGREEKIYRILGVSSAGYYYQKLEGYFKHIPYEVIGSKRKHLQEVVRSDLPLFMNFETGQRFTKLIKEG